MEISDHTNDVYNGIYYKMEDWGGYAHFSKEGRTAHLYFYTGLEDNYWYLDERD